MRLVAKPTFGQILRYLGLPLALSTLAGCTTFGVSAKSQTRDSVGNTVVQATGASNPVISRYDRNYWLEVRQDTAKPVRQMYATLATGEWDAAASQARAYLSLHPGDQAATSVLAAALAMGKHQDLAAYYADRVLQANANDAGALNIKGLAVMSGGKATLADLDRAADYFSKAFNADSTQIASGLNLGHLQLERGNASAARSTFAAVAARCRDCRAATMGLGVSYSRLRNFSEAKAAFSRVLANNPNDSEALYWLALVYKNGYNDIEHAAKILHQLLAGDAGSGQIARERANTLLRTLESQQHGSSPEAEVADERLAPATDQSSDGGAIEQTSATLDELP